MSGTILEARAVISAETKGVAEAEKKLTDLARKINTVGTSTGAIDRATRSFGRLGDQLASRKMVDGLSNFENKVASSRMIERMSRLGAGADKAAAHVTQLGKAMTSMSQVRDLAVGFALERVAAHAKSAGKAIAETYREYDRERRYGRAVMGITDEQQEPLVRQAIHGGGTTKFNDIQFLEAQRELAARGLNVDQVRALTDVAATIGMAMDKSLPESVKALEGAMFGFHKDTSNYDAAVRNATRTADLLVKGSKISGMNYDDLVELYKFSANPFSKAGLSEEQLLAFGAIGKKSNMGGAEMGTAGRALVANLLSPTAAARTAMLAQHIDYSKYQTQGPRPMDAGTFAEDIAAKYGVALDAGAKRALQKVFDDKAVVASAARFMPAIMQVLGDQLGGDDAKSKKSIAGEARRYRDASAAGVDTQRLFVDLMAAVAKSPNLANVIWGSKQGARIRAAIGDPELFQQFLDQLKNHSEGFAADVSSQRMAGFDGAVSRFEGAIKNLETAIGRSLDNGGKGGMLTALADGAARATQAFAELPPVAHQLTAALGAGGTLYVAGKSVQNLMSGFGLSASAVALDESAAALTAAAVRLGVGGAATPLATGALRAGAPGAAAAAGTSVGLLPLLALGAVAAGADYWFNTQVGPQTRTRGRGAMALPDPIIGFTKLSDIPDAKAHGGAGFDSDRAGHYTYGRGGRRWIDEGREPFEPFGLDTVPPSWVHRAMPHEVDVPLPPRRPSDLPDDHHPAMPLEVHLRPDQITAQLEGQGSVNITIHVDASSELLKVVQSVKNSPSIGKNIQLNVGTSMPEAAPGGRGPQ
ncbi:phage tail tape measure protein [Methyloferula stellata]|uniref:phage tail tape measure protein n=1 Tax=Methyloferula stellata TaxID=876270 RepID=UPI0003736C5E|nr:phage tail tape measure protein [Methyloferula stellata]